MQPPPPSDKLFRLVGVAKQFVENPETEEGETKINVSEFVELIKRFLERRFLKFVYYLKI